MSSVPTSQETRHITPAETNWILLLKEANTVYFENRKHINILCRQNSEF